MERGIKEKILDMIETMEEKKKYNSQIEKYISSFSILSRKDLLKKILKKIFLDNLKDNPLLLHKSKNKILQKSKDKILVVSDEPKILDWARLVLKLGDFEVFVSTNIEQALKVLEDHYDEISFVMLNNIMLGRIGYNVLNEIKNNEKYKDIKVLPFPGKSFNQYDGYGGEDDDGFPFPYIFKPPSPPGDLGLVGEPIAKRPTNEEIQKNDPYCKHCGGRLAKGQLICHVCRNKVV